MRHASRRHPQGRARSRIGPVVLLVCWGLLVAGLVSPHLAAAQTAVDADESTLIERYRQARYRALARNHLQRGARLPVRPLQWLPTPTDSLRPTPSRQEGGGAREPSFALHDVRPVRRLERSWFQRRFADVQWSYLGETKHHTFLDTTRTPDLRARLEAHFGAPTRTLADRPLKKPPKRQAQFEYWFVVNDSIPVQVMDTMGPKERGVIVAVERPYRDRLRALRDTLLAPLRTVPRGPHVDYFYDRRRERWYRTGYNGRSFFLEQIPGTRVVPGRRAHLDSVRTSDSRPASNDASPQ